jgi:hypothetical protein
MCTIIKSNKIIKDIKKHSGVDREIFEDKQRLIWLPNMAF